MRRSQSTYAITTFVVLVLTNAAVVETVRAQATTSTTLSSVTTTVTTSSTSTTTIPQVLRCKNRLLNRAKKLTRRLSRCRVSAIKLAKKGKPFDEVACITAATGRYDRGTTESTKFRKGCLACTLDALTPVRDALVVLAVDLDAKIGCAPEEPIAERSMCEIRLHKAVAAYQRGIMACRKEAALLAFEGAATAESSCVATALTRFDEKVAKLSCPACIDTSRIAGTAFEGTDDVITLAQCPCRFGDSTVCAECRACDLSEGCVAADEGEACGRNGCTEETCVNGTCTLGTTVACSDGDVCTVDECLEAEDPSCHGTTCCSHEPLCDPATLDPCVTECSCAATTGCSCRCEPGCDYAGCVIFTDA